MKINRHRFTLSTATLAGLLTLPVADLQAANVLKAATGTDLTLGASWGGTPPGSGDVAAWTGSALGAWLTLGSATAWGGITVTNAAWDINITGAGPRTLGASGLTATAAAVNFSLGTPVILAANQTWAASSLGGGLYFSGQITGTGQTLGIGSVVNGGNAQQGTVTLGGTGNTLNAAVIYNGTLSLTNQTTIPTLTIYEWNKAKSINTFLNLNGGGKLSFNTLALSIQNSGAHVTPAIYLNHGILAAAAGGATIAGGFSLQISAGGATVDTTAGNLTSSSAFLHGVGTPDGGLTLLGGNILTLPNGANTYSGYATLNAGTLSLSSTTTLPNSAGFVIAGGATVDVSSQAAGFSLSDAQSLAATGTNATGTTNGNFTVGNSSPLQFKLAPGVAPLTVTNGTLTLGTANPLTITVVNGGVPLPAGTYPMIATNNGGLVAETALATITFTGGRPSQWHQL